MALGHILAEEPLVSAEASRGRGLLLGEQRQWIQANMSVFQISEDIISVLQEKVSEPQGLAFSECICLYQICWRLCKIIQFSNSVLFA